MTGFSRCDNSQGAEHNANLLVQGQMNSVGALSSSMVSQSENYLSQLMQQLNSAYPTLEGITIDRMVPPTTSVHPSRPTSPGQREFRLESSSNIPSVPTASIRDINLPGFDATMPNITIHETPEQDWPDAPGAPPAVADIELPTMPAYSEPQEPEGFSITLEPAPTIDVPSLQVSRPQKEFSPPGHNFIYVEPDFNDHGLMEPLRDEVLRLLEGEGRMLTEDEEEAMFNRGRDRLRAERERELVKLAKKEAARGFPAPTGTYWAQHSQITEQFSIRLQELIRDVIVEQARLAAQNRPKSVEMAQALVAELMRMYDGTAQRAMQAAVHVWEGGFRLHDAAVADLQAEIAVLDAEVRAHDQELKDAMSRLERWKATLEGARLETEVRESLIRIYEAKWNAIKVAADVHNVEMQGARIKADIQEQQLKNHSLLLQNFGERIQAVIARYDATAKQNAAEMSKAEAFKAQTEAWNMQADAQIKVSGFDIEKAKLRLSEWEAEKSRSLQEFEEAKQRVGVEMESHKNLLATFGEEVKMYEADSRHASAMRDNDIKAYAAAVDENTKIANAKIEEAKMHFEAFVQLKSAIADALSSMAQITGSIASSALNAFSVSAGYHYSGSDSFSCSSTSSTSFAESHSYTY